MSYKFDFVLRGVYFAGKTLLFNFVFSERAQWQDSINIISVGTPLERFPSRGTPSRLCLWLHEWTYMFESRSICPLLKYSNMKNGQKNGQKWDILRSFEDIVSPGHMNLIKMFSSCAETTSFSITICETIFNFVMPLFSRVCCRLCMRCKCHSDHNEREEKVSGSSARSETTIW